MTIEPLLNSNNAPDIAPDALPCETENVSSTIQPN